MKTAAIERAQGVGKGDDYKDMYPATRADNVSREELKETFRQYFQESYNEIRGHQKSLDGCWDKAFAEAVKCDMDRFDEEREFVKKMFGLSVSVDDNGRVTVSQYESSYAERADGYWYDELFYSLTRGDTVRRDVLRASCEEYFQDMYKLLADPDRVCRWDGRIARGEYDGWNAFRSECFFVRKLFGLRVNIDDSGHVTIKGICE